MAQNKITYTEQDRAIVSALKNAESGLTLAQINEAAGIEIKPGHIVSAMKKGLVSSIGEVEVDKPAKRKVSTYNFVTADVLTNAEGKPFNYTDSEKEVLAAAATFDRPFTLADLAAAMGVEKLGSGRTNGLMKKGNITKGDVVTVPCISKTPVKVYGFMKDIPNE